MGENVTCRTSHSQTSRIGKLVHIIGVSKGGGTCLVHGQWRLQNVVLTEPRQHQSCWLRNPRPWHHAHFIVPFS